MEECKICPRQCKVNRSVAAGYCGMTDQLTAARAALHFWEEPCFSGTAGSGTVFFSGCPMHCVFCQNQSIANGQSGKPLQIDRLAEIFLELQEQGAHNINLVTAGHFAPWVAEALVRAKKQGLRLPVIYNSSGYESVETIELLDGVIDVYLPDFKYWEADTARRYSNAPDYPEIAKTAIARMVRQAGEPVFEEETGLMKQGVLVRHLILPGHTKESKAILRYLLETYGNRIYISIMNQYTPMQDMEERGFPELNRRVTKREYRRVIDYALELGLENGFIQEGDTALESFIPDFDGYGIIT